MPCTDQSNNEASTPPTLADAEQQQLIAIARRVIEQGCLDNRWQPSGENYSHRLQRVAACFVTLQKQGQLRGCIGSLHAHQTLVDAIAKNAWSAAFFDPRFNPVTMDELTSLEIEISILSPMQPIDFTDRDNLLEILRPGIDGLMIESGNHQATFLPQVWQQLKEPRQFLDHLMNKAGLNPANWPAGLQASRYQVQHFSEITD